MRASQGRDNPRDHYDKALYRYQSLHSYINRFHKHVLKKDHLGYEEGEYSEDKALKELKEYVEFTSSQIVAFSMLEAYDKLTSSRKMYLSHMAFATNMVGEYLKEADIFAKIPKELNEIARIYRLQKEFLERKQELLGDYLDAKDDFELSVGPLIDEVSKFIKRNIGPRREKQRMYTNESYDYLPYRRLLKRLEDKIEDFDINSNEEYTVIFNKVSELKQLVKLSKMNTTRAKVLLNQLIKLFNKFSLEAQKANSQLEVKMIDAELGVREVAYDYYRATQACSLLGGPGNILLRRAISTDIDLFEDFSPRTSGAIKLIEFLKFNDRDLDFRHAEVITDIERDTRITTMGFYPLSFNWGKDEQDKMPPFVEIKKGYRHCDSKGCDTYNDYRTNFAWLQVNESSAKKITKKKEKALAKIAKKEKYKKLGVCSDFVNWAFGNVITSNWNQIPLVRNLIQLVYPPEGLQTPDNLYESYKTNVICEVENRKLTYPQYVDAHELKDQLLRDLNSTNEAISVHARNSINELIKKDIMDKELNLKYDVINFKTY